MFYFSVQLLHFIGTGSSDETTLIQVVAWCYQGASRYLNQCRFRSMAHVGLYERLWASWLNQTACRNKILQPHSSEQAHCSDIIMSAMSRLFAQPFVQAQIEENFKAPRHWPLWRESIGDRWIRLTKCQLRGNVSILWCHHGGREF